MDGLIDLWERPQCKELYMVAGWHQWADAGAISSGLPKYLISQNGARKIGELPDNNYYLFQIPGTHHFLRPAIQLEDGHRKSLANQGNEFHFVGDENRGLLIFLGTEPHMNVAGYAGAFFAAAKELGVKRIIAVGGVYGAMPYRRDRDVSCVYSLPTMRTEMSEYSVRLSNYHGGATIGSYLLDRAEREAQEYLAFYAFVPAYDFSGADAQVQGIRLENDYRAWHEIMRRVNHMSNLGLDLSDLARLSDELDGSVENKLEELDRKMPQLKVREFVDKLEREFQERPFAPLDDIWEEELSDLFDEPDL